jgi:hypothetical protein
MPYDLHTPFGIMPGQVSPAEQLQAQTFQNARRRAADEDAQSAQLHALKQALGPGGGASRGGDEPDFSFAQGPKDTGAVNLAERNAMVMRRQMNQADMDANAFRSTGLDAGTRERMAQGQARLDKGQMDIQGSAQGVLKSTLEDYLRGGAKPAGMNPNLPGGAGAGPSPNALVGGGGAAAMGGGGGRSSDDELMKLAILQSISSGGRGGGIGDVLKNRDDAALKNREFDMKKSAFDLDMEKTRGDMARWQKEQAEQERLRSDPTAVSSKHPEVTAPLSQQVQQFVAQDTKMLGWDPTDADIDGLAKERDRAARGLEMRGLSPQAAREEANRAIVNALGPNRNDSNNGWTQQLLVRLGINGAPAAGAAQPDIDINAMNYGPG